MKANISTLIFDVNETLLDLQPLKDSINSALNDENAAEVWFSELLQYSLVESITGSYHDFSKIAASVLKMNARKHDLDLEDEKIGEILSPISSLHAYPEVAEGLAKLKQAGYKMIAFSNGKPSVLIDQLEFAGLQQYFDLILSVDAVKKYKPHPDTYSFAVEKAGAELNTSMMVAAHGWDIAGAARAGMQTAFIQREGKFVFPLAPEPTIISKDIRSLASELS
ncbi:2-haloacid dehalogenase [Christiangramia gaetbulicola]|uniref:2-haloacid dehalogenase n=1 Tax=Christiangramia gaetbulicola TaxID=703340 RepID=A0A2T6AM04_9FLAO|nr:haloacid dehalogenase type II [Christiangramia gaetbulicola]PTX44851.1 2-haloacid dehalogenase [Christiangramia gaetbulicola]